MRVRARRRGQGLTEYVVIVGLIAMGLAGAARAFRLSLHTAIVGTATGTLDGVGNAMEGRGPGPGAELPGGGGGAPTADPSTCRHPIDRVSADGRTCLACRRSL